MAIGPEHKSVVNLPIGADGLGSTLEASHIQVTFVCGMLDGECSGWSCAGCDREASAPEQTTRMLLGPFPNRGLLVPEHGCPFLLKDVGNKS